jgi:hypothetical protein
VYTPIKPNWAAASPRTPRKTNTTAAAANDVILDEDIEILLQEIA